MDVGWVGCMLRYEQLSRLCNNSGLALVHQRRCDDGRSLCRVGLPRSRGLFLMSAETGFITFGFFNGPVSQYCNVAG